LAFASGSTFNGSSELVLEISEQGTLANISGTVEGHIFVPEFSSQLTLAGTSTPIATELSFKEVGTSSWERGSQARSRCRRSLAADCRAPSSALR
jgi:hypothetical protein